MNAIFLFDLTGTMSRPWVRAGYDCLCVDIQHCTDNPHEVSPGLWYQRADMMTWVPPREWVEDVAFVAAFPPCDHLAVSGARWFKGKGLGALASSIALFERAAFWAEWFGAPYMIENPVSTISTYWRKPDYTFHPHDFTGFCLDDNYTKKTCLWAGGGFVMPQAHRDESAGAPDDRIHKAPPGEGRANFRSATPEGFAIAVFEANAPCRRNEQFLIEAAE